ncbi:hypothetical protein LVJ94_19230 [Pendulispora rubella]|uniref:Tetratricopeptide repeat protein n=1 Tax=Pendulispora rubella TaxID=2741070 RepID=A0ABZ2LEI5_9BACT
MSHRLGELLQDATPPVTRQQHLEGRARLIASVEKMRRPSRARFYALAAAAGAIMVALVAVAATNRWHAPAVLPTAAPTPSATPSEPPAAVPAPELAPALEPEIIELEPQDKPAVRAVVPPTPAPTWRELVARGEFKRVLREAKAAGFGQVLRTRPATDLRALGDAVRYSGDEDLQARAVYESIRDRFPGTDDAHVSAFVLGRLCEEHANRPDDAIGWYGTYLREAGSGPFAGDARGRTMVLVARRSGRQAARPLAMEYLRLYPHGPYEKPALDLTR